MKKKSLDKEIQNFIDYHGNKKFHIIGGWTENPRTPDERHVPRRIVKGPINRDKCLLCNEPLKSLRKDNPKRRARRFCSDDCRRECYEIEKIRKKLGAENIFWPPQKPPIPKRLLKYVMPDSDGKTIQYNARKISKS